MRMHGLHHRWSQGAVRVLFAAGALLAGASSCALFMDLDVSGYTAEPVAASDAAVVCGPDGGCITVSCIGDKDCDAGSVCCLELTSFSPLAVSATCQAGSTCPPPGLQLCNGGSSDCGDAATCTPCTVGGFTLATCGTSIACTP